MREAPPPSSCAPGALQHALAHAHSAHAASSHSSDASFVAMMSATMRPYRPSAEPKLQMSTMPMYSLGWRHESCTPQLPHMPMARPDARLLRPTVKPAPRCA